MNSHQLIEAMAEQDMHTTIEVVRAVLSQQLGKGYLLVNRDCPCNECGHYYSNYTISDQGRIIYVAPESAFAHQLEDLTDDDRETA